jgi:hypothetical protein
MFFDNVYYVRNIKIRSPDLIKLFRRKISSDDDFGRVSTVNREHG